MTLEERIHFLEQEVAELKQARPGSTLEAPVTITDTSGKTLCRIDRQDKQLYLEMFNSRGKRALVMGVDGTESGMVCINNQDGKPVAFMDVETHGGRIELKDQQGSTGIAIQGNDCDGDTGWLKVLSHKNDDEICLAHWASEEE